MGQTLLPIFPSESTQINGILSFVKREGTVWYFHGCMPVFSHDEKDYRSFNMYTSLLVVVGQCKQVDIMKAFGVSEISVKRHVKKFREGGPGIFFQQRSVRKTTVLTPEVLRRAQEMLNEGKSRDQVSEDLCIKPDTLYRAIHAGKLIELKKKVESKSERSIEEAQSAMGMGCTRVVERVIASIGKLSEASGSESLWLGEHHQDSKRHWMYPMQECYGHCLRCLAMVYYIIQRNVLIFLRVFTAWFMYFCCWVICRCRG